MHLVSNQQLKFEEYNLEVLGIQGEVFKEQPSVLEGYIIHFYLGENASIVAWNDPEFKFSLILHWQHSIPGTLSELQAKMESLKAELISAPTLEKMSNGLDQFAYINLFIVEKDNNYQLMITSETFNISKLIDLS